MNYLSFIGGAVLALGMGTLARHAPHGAAKHEAAAKHVAADSTYTVTGTIAGLNTGWVWLRHSGGYRIDSCPANKGTFTFSGRVSEPEHCWLGIAGPTGQKEFGVELFLESGDITVSGNKNAFDKSVVSGGSVMEEYKQYLQMETTERPMNRAQMAKAYAKAHPASYIAAFELLNYYTYNPDAAELDSIYNGLDTTIRASASGRELKKTLDAAILTGIGHEAPAFTQDNTKGVPVSLADFKGQYVLVDFWASWCGPCRAENPNVLKAYRQYHSKGFTILGVSLDDHKDRWLEAIKKDGLPWMQVSDLKGWQNSAAVLYGVGGIPMNFLLDKDGKIVGKGLRDEDLDKKLAELVH
jgi:thiol-disulfide isomerase/thioredoxin